MVSSEAESDSVISEPPRHDDMSIVEPCFQDKPVPDVRAIGTTLASLVSTRGRLLPIPTASTRHKRSVFIVRGSPLEHEILLVEWQHVTSQLRY